MTALNYKHLRYFWAVAKFGSIARASQQLNVAPQSISGQLAELAESLGVALFRRAGRGLELTHTGRRLLGYAEEIFALGDEFLHVARDEAAAKSLPFAVGVSDSVQKSLAYRLVEPALHLAEPVRLICREGRLTSLLAELAVHRLDLVIADRAMPGTLNVRGYSHLLGQSDLTIFGAAGLIDKLGGAFPTLLEGAPFLMPGDDVAIRPSLEQWLQSNNLHPRIVGEFDDSALLNAFGQAGAGLFAAPSAIADYMCDQYRVVPAGGIPSVSEQLFAITTERHLTHPAVVAISEAARHGMFGDASRNVRAGSRTRHARGATRARKS